MTQYEIMRQRVDDGLVVTELHLGASDVLDTVSVRVTLRYYAHGIDRAKFGALESSEVNVVSATSDTARAWAAEHEECLSLVYEQWVADQERGDDRDHCPGGCELCCPGR